MMVIDAHVLISSMKKNKQMAYRKDQKDIQYEGPISMREYTCGFFKDSLDRSKFKWLHPAVIVPILLIYFFVWILVMAQIPQDTSSYLQQCMRMCSAMEGMMIDRTEYGCVCYTNGERRIFD